MVKWKWKKSGHILKWSLSLGKDIDEVKKNKYSMFEIAQFAVLKFSIEVVTGKELKCVRVGMHVNTYASYNIELY